MKLSEYRSRPAFNDLSFLSTKFHLGHIRISKDLGGTYNLNLLLNTERGNYVLRLYRSWVTRERLSQLQHVKHLLSLSSFPVPLPISTNTGETILEYNNSLMELEPFIAHDGIADTRERNIEAFALMGQLHSFFATETNHVDLINPIVSNYGTPEQLLTWIRQVREEVSESKQALQTSEGKYAITLYDEAIALLSPLQEWWRKTHIYLLRQLTHGDYGGGNILFRQEHIVAILDFDFLRVRERVCELAYSLYWWLWKLGKLTDMDFWPRVKELLDAYNQATQNPLSSKEMQSIPVMMICVPLCWIAETLLLPEPMQEVIKQGQKVANARWLFEHREQLMELLLCTS